MASNKRILVLPISAAIILMLVIYKETRTYPDRTEQSPLAVRMQPAPLFEAYNSNNRLAKFEGFIGRHRIIVVFFDGKAGADLDESLLKLRDNYEAIKKSDTIVVGVSTALPSENRKVFVRLGKKLSEQSNRSTANGEEQNSQQEYEKLGKFPFPLLTDTDFSVHQLWGRYDEQNRTPLTGLFLVDRVGQVAVENGFPKPLDNPNRLIQSIIDGEL